MACGPRHSRKPDGGFGVYAHAKARDSTGPSRRWRPECTLTNTAQTRDPRRRPTRTSQPLTSSPPRTLNPTPCQTHTLPTTLPTGTTGHTMDIHPIQPTFSILPYPSSLRLLHDTADHSGPGLTLGLGKASTWGRGHGRGSRAIGSHCRVY